MITFTADIKRLLVSANATKWALYIAVRLEIVAIFVSVFEACQLIY